MERFRQRCQNKHRARAGKCRVSIGHNVLLVPPLVESTLHAYSMQPAYTVLKAVMNRGEGTNRWDIPKSIDMLLLPEYMRRLGSTGRFMLDLPRGGWRTGQRSQQTQLRNVGMAFLKANMQHVVERGWWSIMHSLRWIPRPKMRKMMRKILSKMIRMSGDLAFTFKLKEIQIIREENKFWRLISIRGRKHIVCKYISWQQFFNTSKVCRLGDVFEYRTEALIQGKRYWVHPNYRGDGPWYDFVLVEFQLELDVGFQPLVDENNKYPAKLLGFYRSLTSDGEESTDFQVLAHCVQYQRFTRRFILGSHCCSNPGFMKWRFALIHLHYTGLLAVYLQSKKILVSWTLSYRRGETDYCNLRCKEGMAERFHRWGYQWKKQQFWWDKQQY
jgi:hypothetical protein